MILKPLTLDYSIKLIIRFSLIILNTFLISQNLYSEEAENSKILGLGKLVLTSIELSMNDADVHAIAKSGLYTGLKEIWPIYKINEFKQLLLNLSIKSKDVDDLINKVISIKELSVNDKINLAYNYSYFLNPDYFLSLNPSDIYFLSSQAKKSIYKYLYINNTLFLHLSFYSWENVITSIGNDSKLHDALIDVSTENSNKWILPLNQSVLKQINTEFKMKLVRQTLPFSTRKQTVLDASIEISNSEDDIRKIIEKYAFGVNFDDLEIKIRGEFTKLNTDRILIPISEFFPPFGKNKLNTFSGCHGPDCLESALDYIGKLENNLIPNNLPPNLKNFLIYNFRLVSANEKLLPGDLIMYFDNKENKFIHASNFVAHDDNTNYDLVFTKNGTTAESPYILQYRFLNENIYITTNDIEPFVFRIPKTHEQSIFVKYGENFKFNSVHRYPTDIEISKERSLSYNSNFEKILSSSEKNQVAELLLQIDFFSKEDSTPYLSLISKIANSESKYSSLNNFKFSPDVIEFSRFLLKNKFLLEESNKSYRSTIFKHLLSNSELEKTRDPESFENKMNLTKNFIIDELMLINYISSADLSIIKNKFNVEVLKPYLNFLRQLENGSPILYKNIGLKIFDPIEKQVQSLSHLFFKQQPLSQLEKDELTTILETGNGIIQNFAKFILLYPSSKKRYKLWQAVFNNYLNDHSLGWFRSFYISSQDKQWLVELRDLLEMEINSSLKKLQIQSQLDQGIRRLARYKNFYEFLNPIVNQWNLKPSSNFSLPSTKTYDTQKCYSLFIK